MHRHDDYFRPPELPGWVRAKRDALRAAGPIARWCDDERLREENAPGTAPGGFLAPFGWYVVGTTIGGNAVVVGEADPAVWFADHTWYHDGDVSHPDPVGGGAWVDRPLTAAAVAESLRQLAVSIDTFVSHAEEVDLLLRRLD